MKSTASNLLRISVLILVLACISSCKRSKEADNYFKIGDKTYEVKSGCIINNGEVSGGFDIDLRIYDETGKNFLNFALVSKQAESIASSTYNVKDGSAWVLGYNKGNYTDRGPITSGKIVINRSASGYSIEINCTDKYSTTIKGYFKGNLSKQDENNLVHKLPDYVLPEEIYSDVTQHLPIHFGVNPPEMTGEYVSSPHVLIYESNKENPDSIQLYSDRYLGFLYSNKQMNFYGKQYDSVNKEYIEEVQYGLKITGDNDYFTCYYVVDGYPDGYYAQQSFIFSGKKTDNGLEDFHTGVVLLETSGHPYLPEKHTYRVLKDYDGLAEENNWLSGKSRTTSINVKNEDLFDIWMK